MARERDRLSAVALPRLAKKPGVYGDGGGLNLKVRSDHSVAWTYRFMLHGVAREMGLGRYPDISLSRARELAAEARAMRAAGRNPIVERANASAMTFKGCAERYVGDRKEGWKNKKHAQQWSSTLERYAYPKLAKVPVGAVDTALVVAVLKPIWRAKPETAKRVRGRIEAILDWAKAHGYRTTENPARRGYLVNLLPAQQRTVTHHAALPLAELPEFMQQLLEQPGVAARALEFAILTAARTGEVIGATWSEIDLKSRTWTVPAARMKAGAAHRVPLSDRVIGLLAATRDEANSSAAKYLFLGAARGTPLSNMALLAVLKRMGRDDVTTHGFRSVFRDWAAEHGYPRELAEAALAHAVGNKVEAAYLRTTLLDRRREMMDAWAKTCDS